MAASPQASASAPSFIQLPLTGWTEDATLTHPSTGRKLQRWGRISQACAILNHCDRETMYALIKSHQVRGYQLNPLLRNSPYKVDLLSVWEHKQGQMSAR